MKLPSKLLAMLCLLTSSLLLAQSPVSGFMKKNNEGSVVISYSMEKYDKVFLVPQEVDGVPVFNEVTNTSISLYGEFGITDNLNVVFNVPYIKSEGEATEGTLESLGFENTREGIQDLSLYVKYNFHTFNLGKSDLSFIGSIGLETPLSDYEANEGLQSIIAIGNHASSFNALGIAMFKTDSGFFTTGQVGYSFKDSGAPHAFLSQLKVGYAASKFYVDGYIANQLSEKDGVDILGEGFTGYFPATRVNYTRVGLNAFAPIFDGIGISAGANTYIAGRNLGKSTGFYGGLVYSF
ncbi:hypothetical protein [Aequorivita capsosiphonis]|uniref:hypothetical protein n=1 Tax=Aequorivita capsosiphonis TaxID=487317 RepID=UPI00047A2BE6|nr:hypothetical protein [Aequorivita capsosiphonis]